MNLLRRSLAGCLAALALGSAHAGVLQTDDATFGVDAVIRDTTHARDFLRLDFTTAYTYDQALAALGGGGVFSGWSIASRAQMEALGVSAGLSHGATDAASLGLAEQLRDWFCFTCVETSTTHIYARGLISDVITVDIGAGPVDVQEAFSIGRRLNVTPNEVDFRVSGWYYTDAKLSPNEGIYLTRAAVPEPGVILLLLIAALAMTAESRRPQTVRIPARRD